MWKVEIVFLAIFHSTSGSFFTHKPSSPSTELLECVKNCKSILCDREGDDASSFDVKVIHHRADYESKRKLFIFPLMLYRLPRLISFRASYMWRCHKKRGQDESNFIAFAFNGRKRANITARPNARNVSEGKYWITLSARRALWCCTHSHHTLTTCLLLICLIIIQIFPRFSFFFGVRRFSSLYFTQTFVLVCVFIPRIALLSTSNALQNDPRVAREHNDDFVSVATRCQSVPLFSHRWDICILQSRLN